MEVVLIDYFWVKMVLSTSVGGKCDFRLFTFSMYLIATDPLSLILIYYHVRGKITGPCLAEKEVIFFLITRALLVIKKVWSLDADWLSVSALSWFPALNGFWKWISDTHRFTVISSNVKENQHETKCSFGHLFASFIDRWGGLTPSQASQNKWIQLDCLSFVCKAVAFNELWICELFTVFCLLL